MDPLSSARQNVNTLLQAAEQRDKTHNEIAFAVLAKQQDAAKQAGAAINQMLSQAVEVGRQLAQGHLDVQV